MKQNLNKEQNKLRGGEKDKGKRKMKLIIASIIFTVLLASSGFAVWLWVLEGSFTALVDSEQPITIFTQEFPDMNISTTDSNRSAESIGIIDNQNGIIPVTFNAVETLTDIADDCTYDNDCIFSYKTGTNGYQYQDIAQEDEFELQEGLTYVKAIMNCDRWSCPASNLIEVSLVQT